MPRPTHRRQVPKGARRRSPVGKGTHVGQPDDFVAMQAQAVARRYALKDRAQHPLHCYDQMKLMYDTEEITKSTGEALQCLRGQRYDVYPCPVGRHWHLTTTDQVRREA